MNKDNNKIGMGVSESKSELGIFIRKRRMELGYRQAELAKKLKILQSAVSSIELGNRSLVYYHGFNWRKMAKALKCSIKEIEKRLPKIEIQLPQTDLGWFIQNRRKELKMTIKEFAKRMNIPTYRADYLEKRKHETRKYEMLRKIADALSVEISELSNFTIKCRRECTNDLGRIIREQRKNLCISGIEFAAKLGVTRQYVNQIEGGAINMIKSEQMLKKIAVILKLDFEKLKASRPKKKEYGKRKK